MWRLTSSQALRTFSPSPRKITQLCIINQHVCQQCSSSEAFLQWNAWCSTLKAFQDCVCLQPVSVVLLNSRVGVCACVRMCPRWCCTVNAEPCPEHIKADQRLSRSVLLIERAGQCACASQHLLVRKCQLSSPHCELKTSPRFLVSLWGVVMCVVRVREGGRVSLFDLTGLNLIDCDGAGEDT